MGNPVDLAAGLARIRDIRILCIGDVMLDRYIYGEVERISPEGPIPVLRIDRERAMLGGAGNVVRNVVSLGGEAAFVAVVGDDSAGREIVGLVGREPRILPDVLIEAGRRTTIKTRYIAAHQQMLRADVETSDAARPETLERLREVAAAEIVQCSALVLSDYGKGVLTPEVVEALIAIGRAAGVPVVVDPKGIDYSRYRGADIVTPNRRELAEATRMPVGGDEEIVAAARWLIAQSGVERVLVTRSQEGMTLVAADGHEHLLAEAREVFDVSGAGDTVVAALAAGLGAGMEVADAARLANVAAGIVVGKAGTATVEADEVAGMLHKADLLAGVNKLVPLDRAVERVSSWRAAGLRIGFTNGCFDLLHPGHVALIAQARAACDRLVIGLNDDASVRRLKGPERPVHGELARGTVLSSLGSVDLVVLFAEDTPVRLIEALRPDVLVKGSDYTVDQVVGADLVRNWGGRVMLADLLPGFSTTATVAKLRR